MLGENPPLQAHLGGSKQLEVNVDHEIPAVLLNKFKTRRPGDPSRLHTIHPQPSHFPFPFLHVRSGTCRAPQTLPNDGGRLLPSAAIDSRALS